MCAPALLHPAAPRRLLPPGHRAQPGELRLLAARQHGAVGGLLEGGQAAGQLLQRREACLRPWHAVTAELVCMVPARAGSWPKTSWRRLTYSCRTLLAVALPFLVLWLSPLPACLPSCLARRISPSSSQLAADRLAGEAGRQDIWAGLAAWRCKVRLAGALWGPPASIPGFAAS